MTHRSHIAHAVVKVKTIILSAVFYGCETFSVILKEEYGLGMFDNRVLGIFGPKRDRVTGYWKKLHNEELHNLYSSSTFIRTIKSRRMRWVGHMASMGEMGNGYNILFGKSEGKKPTRKTWA
jgi:hypothetical protein